MVVYEKKISKITHSIHFLPIIGATIFFALIILYESQQRADRFLSAAERRRDEPLNYIDIIRRRQAEDLILKSMSTLLFVEQDKSFL